MDLGQTDPELGNMQTQVINLLTKHMKQYLINVSKGSRMSSNVSMHSWAGLDFDLIFYFAPFFAVVHS